MQNTRSIFFSISIAISGVLLTARHGQEAPVAGPVKVFLMAGQSNMDGQASDYTLKFIGKDTVGGWSKKMGFPANLRKIFVPDETHYMGRRDVWVANGSIYDTLQIGYGGRNNYNVLGNRIGPEYAFGYYMGEKYSDQVLLIKYGPGGTSLRVPWRPPSAGSTGDPMLDTSTITQTEATTYGHLPPLNKVGLQYRYFVRYVHQTLDSLGKRFPSYNGTSGYEIVGLVWFQGYNDVADNTSNAEYKKCLVALINDLRVEFKSPKMKVVVGVLGVNGVLNEGSKMGAIRNAQRSIDSMPEFKGNAKSIESAPLLYPPLVDVLAAWLTGRNLTTNPETPAEKLIVDSCGPIRGQAYHYWGNGSFFVYLGKAFADTMNAMEEPVSIHPNLHALKARQNTGPKQILLLRNSRNIPLISAGNEYRVNFYNLGGRKIETVNRLPE